MPVLTRCPMCRAVLPPGARGETRCPGCRELVLPASRKLCGRCSMDVSREKRVKDVSGEYYCHTCWTQICEEAGYAPGFVCGKCGQTFSFDDVYQVGDALVCRGCKTGIPQGVQIDDVDPDQLLEAAAEMGDASPVIFTPTTTYRRWRWRRPTEVWVMVAWIVGIACFAILAALVAIVVT